MPFDLEPSDDGPLMSQTISSAMRHGWAWKIPLTSRNGNGYVYSSAHVSADEAETELRTHLGLLDADVPALDQRCGAGAGFDDPRVPQPFVETLLVQSRSLSGAD